MVLLISLLLPGTLIVYYGDEISMCSQEPIPCDLTMDPYALWPYAECDDFPEASRDPARTPMQWTGGPNAGFSNTTGDLWLPVDSNYDIYNVETQRVANYSTLKLFKSLMDLRKEDAIHKGEIFFPYFDEDVFSFLRWDEEGWHE